MARRTTSKALPIHTSNTKAATSAGPAARPGIGWGTRRECCAPISKSDRGYGGGKDFPDGMVDWPISYDDLEPWYCEAEWEMGVAGSDEEWQDLFGSHRSHRFPMSMIWPSYSDTWIAGKINGEKFDGFEYRVKSTPSARNSSLYDGRPPCAGNSICVPVCPIGAKYDGYVHVAKAVAAKAELREKCVVNGMDKDKDGSVHTVHYLNYDGVPGHGQRGRSGPGGERDRNGEAALDDRPWQQQRGSGLQPDGPLIQEHVRNCAGKIVSVPRATVYVGTGIVPGRRVSCAAGWIPSLAEQ